MTVEIGTPPDTYSHVLTRTPTVDNFKTVDAEVPRPGDGEVLIRAPYLSVDPYARVRRKVVSSDPQRRAVLSRLRLIWRHLPEGGGLLFCDVKPVFAKAYGGRRRTSAKRLVLPKPQRTRGKFYLFLLHDVRAGRVRRRYLPGKSSEHVCRFMRQVRRW